MPNRRLFILLLSIAAIGLSCGDSSNDDDLDDALEVEATLTNVQSLVFTPSCTNEACHDSSAAGGLELSTAVSYASLVNVPATYPTAAARGKLRVVPGDADASFLFQKLRGTMEADEGVLMPREASSLVSSKLALVRAWIEAGAKND